MNSPNGNCLRWKRSSLYILLSLLACTVLVPGCSPKETDVAETIDTSKPALKFEPKETVAYVGGLSITVYMVADDKVLLLDIPLSKSARKGRITIPIGQTGVTAILYEGKDVWKNVQPMGEPAHPDGPVYTKESATSGNVVCGNLPAEKTWPYGTAISVAEVHVLFPSGRIRVSQSMTLTLQVPPT